MANQLFSDGDVIQPTGSVQLECVSVSYSEQEGEKFNFSYTFRPKSDLDAEREAAKKSAEEAEAAQAQPVSDEAPAEAVNQPEAPQEETHYVK